MQLIKLQIDQHYNTALAFIQYSEDAAVVNGIVKAFKNTLTSVITPIGPLIQTPIPMV